MEVGKNLGVQLDQALLLLYRSGYLLLCNDQAVEVRKAEGLSP